MLLVFSVTRLNDSLLRVLFVLYFRYSQVLLGGRSNKQCCSKMIPQRIPSTLRWRKKSTFAFFYKVLCEYIQIHLCVESTL